MSSKIHVTDRFQLTGIGTLITALILDPDTAISPGDLFTEESTGNSVRIRGIEQHPRQSPEGLVIGLAIEESTPRSIQPGSTLVRLT